MSENGERIYKDIDWLSNISRGFQGSIVLAVAVQHGVFSLLDESGALTSDEAAGRLGLDARATDILLHALAGIELLETSGGGGRKQFRNAPLADRLLVKGRKYYQGDIIAHNRGLMERWLQLPSVLETGRPVEGPKATEDKQSRRDFILGMSNIAVLSAEKVAEGLDLSQARRVLDLGGGPGTYAITFCRMNPDLEAVVFDLPEVIDEITAGQVERAELTDRISFIRGDYMEDDYGRDYDLVLVSNIIHSQGLAGNLTLLERCHRSMARGGRIAVKDFLLDEDRVTPRFSSMFALNMLINTQKGGCFTVSEVSGWLAKTGFEGAELVDLSPQARMLVAVKP